jgi:hypothetical protein
MSEPATPPAETGDGPQDALSGTSRRPDELWLPVGLAPN